MGKGITYSTSGRDCPCCGCQERTVGCHGTCERYKAWDGKRQAEKLERFRRTSILHEADKRKSAAVSHYKRRGRQIQILSPALHGEPWRSLQKNL